MGAICNKENNFFRLVKKYWLWKQSVGSNTGFTEVAVNLSLTSKCILQMRVMIIHTTQDGTKYI